MQKSKIYFPNLNGLRFIAALFVIIAHINMVNSFLGLNVSPIFDVNLGSYGVILFFTLSGFLITYLLLEEENKTKTISIKDFYIRRVLRIWPLYYSLVIICFFVLPYIPFFELPHAYDVYSFKYLFLFMLILPNVAVKGMDVSIPYLGQTWSVGVEEQFYLIWPILMKFIKKKQTLLISIIIGYLAIKFLVLPVLLDTVGYHRYLYVFMRVWNEFYIDCMAIGGLFAVWHFQKKKFLDKVYHPVFGIVVIVLILIVLFTPFSIPYVINEFFALLIALLIINLATGKKPIINLENKVFDYLGRISYGLYMYHFIGIVLGIKLLDMCGFHSWGMQVILSTLFTILISSLSYHLLEERFIKMKKRFSKIISGENAK